MTQPAGKQTALRADLSQAGGRRRSLLWLTGLCLIMGLVLLGLAGIYRWYFPPAPPPPAIDLQGADPVVAEAIQQGISALSQSRGSGKAWGRLGMILFAHGYLSEAETCLREAERLEASEPRWPYYQGILLTLRDGEAAVIKLRRALELSSKDTEVIRLRLGDALLAQGHAEEASEQYEQALTRSSTNAAAQLGLARAAFERGEWQKSLSRLGACANNPATRKAAHSLLAAVYPRLGNEQAAERERHAADLLPEDVEPRDALKEEVDRLSVDRLTRVRRASLMLGQGRAREALSLLNELVRTYPQWDLAWETLGYALLQQGDYANAKRALREALRLQPASAEAWFYLGAVANSQANPAEAADCFRKAGEIRPDYGLAYYQLGRCLKQTGDWQGAVEALRMALRSRPYLAEAHRELGSLFLEKGQLPEAVTHLQHAVSLAPEDKEAAKLLAAAQAHPTAPR